MPIRSSYSVFISPSVVPGGLLSILRFSAGSSLCFGNVPKHFVNVTSIYSFGSSGVCRNSLIPATSSRGSGFTLDILSSLLRPVRFSAGFGFCFQVFLSFLWTRSSLICSFGSFGVYRCSLSDAVWDLPGCSSVLVVSQCPQNSRDICWVWSVPWCAPVPSVDILSIYLSLIRLVLWELFDIGQVFQELCIFGCFLQCPKVPDPALEYT